MILDFIHAFNHFAWITVLLLLVYISVFVIVFAVYYPIVFNPKATTVGKNIFRFFMSLVGVIGLLVIGLYVEPITDGRSPYEYVEDVLIWRPFVRLIIYGYVAYSITSLVIVLIIRKYWPYKLRTALDVKVREHHHK